jgi:Domain of unknown function (DUF4410)
MKGTRFFTAMLTSAFLMVPAAMSQTNSGSTTEKKYSYIQVNRFDVQQGIDFPPDYQLTIVEDVSTELGKIKGMKQVLREGETLPEEQPVLVVTGTITKYTKGNQAARYLVGFGAGATVIHAHIKCYDAITKEVLFERDVDGKVIMGLMGGKSEGANNGLAKEIAKDIKEKFFAGHAAGN